MLTLLLRPSTLALVAALSLGCPALAQSFLPTAPPSASPDCALGLPVLDLPTYQADRETRGTLHLDVTCPQPTQRYRLRLNGWQITPQGDAVAGAGAGQLRLEVLGAAPALTGQEWTGTVRLRFAVRIAAGQWGVAGGSYAGALSVSLEPVGGG